MLRGDFVERGCAAFHKRAHPRHVTGSAEPHAFSRFGKEHEFHPVFDGPTNRQGIPVFIDKFLKDGQPGMVGRGKKFRFQTLQIFVADGFYRGGRGAAAFLHEGIKVEGLTFHVPQPDQRPTIDNRNLPGRFLGNVVYKCK